MNKLSIFLLFVGVYFTYPIYGQPEMPDDEYIALPFIPQSNFDHYPQNINYDLVEDRLSCLESTIPLNFNDRVYAFVKYFTEKDREYTRMVINRSTYYFPIFEKILKKYGLPEEIKYLSIIESGLNPRAISRMGAVGLWQFMPYTGRFYGLHQDWYVDERMDPYKATEAAVKYLKQLYGMFGDWELALAAYNTGPGNVRKAIRRSGYKKNFWKIYRYLPRETRSYVPQWVAIMYALNYAKEHNLNENSFEYEMAFDTIHVSRFTDMKTLAGQLNICLDDLRKLNPAIKHDALPDNINSYPVRIPADKYDFLMANRKEILDSASKTGRGRIQYLARNSVGSTYGRDKIIHRVRSGDVLGIIAEKYKVRISDIRKWNNLRGNLIRIGQRLDIWIRPGTYNSQDQVPVTAKKEITEELDGMKIYNVQPGDTLWDISRKFKGLTIEKIKKLNKLNSNKIKPGQKLIIG